MVGVVRNQTNAFQNLRKCRKQENLDIERGAAHSVNWIVLFADIDALVSEIEAEIAQRKKIEAVQIWNVFRPGEVQSQLSAVDGCIAQKIRALHSMIMVAQAMPVSKQEDTVRRNALRRVAQKMSEFRASVRPAQMSVADVIESEDDPGFTGEQTRILQTRRQIMATNAREIEGIHTSIVELSEIFRDFQRIVTDQGTVLDRIDYNIDQTMHNVVKAKKEIEQAETYQKGQMSKIGLLVFLLIFFCVVFVSFVRVVIKLL